MRADANSTTISRFTNVAMAADARHLALCLSGAEDKKISTALNTRRRAMVRLTATPAVNITDIQRKCRVLETAIEGTMIEEGGFGLIGSMLQDLRNLGCDG